MKSPIINRQSQIDYEAAVQELDGPAEARLTAAMAWLLFRGMALLCWIEGKARAPKQKFVKI